MRRPVEERINDYREVYQPFPEEKVRVRYSNGAARCMDCGIPFLPHRLSGQQHHSGLGMNA